MKPTFRISVVVTAILLAIWGLYTVLEFIGVPAHYSVLVLQSMYEQVMGICDVDANICRGFNALWPMVETFFIRLKPLGTYLLLSLFSWIVLVGFSAFVHGKMEFRYNIRPWHIFATFVAAVWVMQISIASQPTDAPNSLGTLQLVEASAKIFPGAQPELIEAMQANIATLEEQNCLTQSGTAGTATVYSMSFTCVHKAFFSRIFTQILFITALLFFLISVGRLVFLQLKLPVVPKGTEVICSAILGACVFIVALWLLAIAGLFIAPALWVLVAVGFVVSYKHVYYWWRVFTTYNWEVRTTWYSFGWLCAWLLLSLLALNFLTVIRPFPIGWDDLGVYLNEPRLLVSFGSVTPFFAAFRWEYLTALGFGFFGYESTFAATASMMINWSAGLLAVGTIILLLTRFVRMQTAIIAALLYYMLPIVGHFSFADMKTDNAVFLFQFAAIISTLLYLFPRTDEEAKSSGYGWLVFAGICTAIGLGTKPTTAMALFTVLALLAAGFTNVFGFLAAAFAAFAVFTLQGVLNIVNIGERIGVAFNRMFAVGLFVFIAATFAILACYKKQKNVVPLGKAAGVYLVTFFAAIVPWLVYVNIQHDDLTPKLRFRTPAIGTTLEYTDLPADLAIDTTHEACQSSARVEELDRYWGNYQNIGHYALLPWRSVMNTDISGYYVTSYAALLLAPFLLLLPFFWKKEEKWLRLFAGATAFLVIQWVLLANGVVWYGIGMFGGLVLMIALLTDSTSKAISSVATGLITLSIFTAFSMRMWQFDIQKNMYEYQTGKMSEEVMAERTIPHYNNVREAITELRGSRPDSPYVYRVGTFIPYFIPRNFEVFGRVDHQLDFFNCLHQERDNKKTLQRLQALGFNSFIFDTNTATIEKDPNGSLHTKVNTFISWINDPTLGITALVNDPQAGIAFLILPE